MNDLEIIRDNIRYTDSKSRNLSGISEGVTEQILDYFRKYYKDSPLTGEVLEDREFLQ